MHRASCPPGSQLVRSLCFSFFAALIAMGCGDENGRPFGNLQIMTGPDGGQAPADSGSGGGGVLGVGSNGGPPGSVGAGGKAGTKGVGGASGVTPTGGLSGLGSAGASVVPGTG